jgi:antitoxin component of MazEF toxin-antitoxin module
MCSLLILVLGSWQCGIDSLTHYSYNYVITQRGKVIKQLRKVGNSNALILDKPILELLGLEEDGQVQLTIQDGLLIVAPANPRQLTPDELQDHLDYVVKKRQGALKRLAQ